jgi:hypothetical protein
MRDDLSPIDPDWIVGRLEYEEHQNGRSRSKHRLSEAPMTAPTPIKRPAALGSLGQIARGLTHLRAITRHSISANYSGSRTP